MSPASPWKSVALCAPQCYVEFMLPIFAELKSLWTFKSESENVSKVRHCFKEARVEGMGKFLNHFL